MISIRECENAIKPLLSSERYYHSQCVSKAAVTLAQRFGADPEKAAVAGMLHDIMKDSSKEEQLKIINGSDIILSETEGKLSKLLHAISGAEYIRTKLHVEDEEVLGAVRWHTSGRKNMSLLEKIIFIADFISEDREYPGVDEMRRLAEISLEAAMYEGISFTIKELLSLKSYIDLNTVEAYNQLIDEMD